MSLPSIQTDLFEPPNTQSIEVFSAGLINALSSPIAFSVATLAVASLGFAMLSGRLEIKRGIAIILGCFVLYAARSIAKGLMGFAQVGAPGMAQASEPPNYANPGGQSGAALNGSNPFDPYAGAAVLQ